MTEKFTLHPQLAKDTHCLFDSEKYFILLHKNATIPWIIIVPKTNHTEIFDLPHEIQKDINIRIKSIEQIFQSIYSTKKMNIAAIGNMVPQLHIHVIGRKPDDACWPSVVWGADYPFTEYSLEQINNLQLLLSKSFC